MAEASTRLLRGSSDPLYARVRQLLTERGVDVEHSALAAFFPDDTNMEFGVVVTPDRRVYEFDLHYGKGDLTQQVAPAQITDWRDRTDWWRDMPRRTDVEDAMRLLDRY